MSARSIDAASRALAVGAGIWLLLVPDRVVAPAERLAFENPGDGQLRAWTLPVARLKGAIVCWLLVRGSGRDVPTRPLLVAGGAVLALVPRRAAAAGLYLAYENPDELEVKPWVAPATRLLGVLALAAGLGSAANRRREE